MSASVKKEINRSAYILTTYSSQYPTYLVCIDARSVILTSAFLSLMRRIFLMRLKQEIISSQKSVTELRSETFRLLRKYIARN